MKTETTKTFEERFDEKFSDETDELAAIKKEYDL